MTLRHLARQLAQSALSASHPKGAPRAPKLPAQSLSALQFFVAVGALFGGVALLSTPDGRFLHMPTSLLRGTPFRDFFLPGLLLTFGVGGSALAGGYVAARRHPATGLWGLTSGLVLIVWILSEVALIGYLHWLQLAYLVLGLIIAVLGARLRQD